MTRRFILVAVLLCGAVAQTSSQTPRLNRVMRDKLGHAQALVAAVVTSDWVGLERHGEALRRATQDPAWTVLTEPEYASQTASFIKSLDGLLDAARTRDLDAAPSAYATMMLRCVACHRYVARRRVAGHLEDAHP